MNEQYILDSQTKSFVTTHCTCYAEHIWLLKVSWKHFIFVMAPFLQQELQQRPMINFKKHHTLLSAKKIAKIQKFVSR